MESITDKVIHDYRIWRDDYWKNKCKKNDTYTYKRDGKKVESKIGFLKKRRRGAVNTKKTKNVACQNRTQASVNGGT